LKFYFTYLFSISKRRPRRCRMGDRRSIKPAIMFWKKMRKVNFAIKQLTVYST